MSADAPIEGTGGAFGPEPIAVTKQAISTGMRFGTWCTQSYQNGWQTTLGNSWTRCSWFNNELDDTDQLIFYYDLVGKKYFWERFGDTQPPAYDSADDVDLLFVNTHGGTNTGNTQAVYAMWNDPVYAITNEMRLGDSAWWGGGLAILATYACKTLWNGDNNIQSRWGAAFRGGLKIALGSHDTVWDHYYTEEVGEDFADNMQNGQAFVYAWRDGLEDWYYDQDIMGVATGTSEANCATRRDTMKKSTYGTFPFIRDGAIVSMCKRWWTNY